MAQQSDTEPRKAPKTQGHATHDLQQRIINRQENTRGTDAPLTDETLKHADLRYPKPGPGDENAMQTGHREIQRGANDESAHRKRRSQ
jgi:hypothetical protein